MKMTHCKINEKVQLRLLKCFALEVRGLILYFTDRWYLNISINSGDPAHRVTRVYMVDMKSLQFLLDRLTMS